MMGSRWPKLNVVVSWAHKTMSRPFDRERDTPGGSRGSLTASTDGAERGEE